MNNRHTKATHWIFSATHNGGKYFLKKYSHLFLKYWLISPLIGDNFCIRVFAQAQVHTSIPRFRHSLVSGKNSVRGCPKRMSPLFPHFLRRTKILPVLHDGARPYKEYAFMTIFQSNHSHMIE